MPDDAPTPETAVSVATAAPKPAEGAAPNKPAPPAPAAPTQGVGLKSPAPSPADDVAPKDEKKEEKEPSKFDQLQEPKPNEKQKEKKDPILELMDELQAFTEKNNIELRGLFTGKGSTPEKGADEETKLSQSADTAPSETSDLVQAATENLSDGLDAAPATPSPSGTANDLSEEEADKITTGPKGP